MKIKAALIALVACLPLPATCAEWPDGPVEVVVPYAAGGAADVMGRVFMDAIGTRLGHTFILKNVGGAGGLLGARQVARAAPDGRTLVISGAASHVLAPLMSRDANLDPVKEFTHIAYFGGAPTVLAVHPSTGIKTMAEFLAYMRNAKESVGYVSPGVGTAGHMTASYLAEAEKINLVHVPHKGGGTAILDVVAGHVKVASMNWSTAREHVSAGALTAIAITSGARIPGFPDLPTFRELGYADLVMATWYGLSAPAGTPADVVAKLNSAAIASLGDARVKRQLELEAAEPKSFTPQEFSDFVAGELKRWGPLAARLRDAN